MLLCPLFIQLTNTKSWRLSPAIHMWRGYPHALGVYIRINCAIWASRKSATTGRNFSNAVMDQHIDTFGFGRNDLGAIVGHDVEQAAQAAIAATDHDDAAVGAPAAASAAAAAAAAPPAAAAAAAPSPPPQSSTPAQRSGTYVDGIRIPWWFHDARIHDSDAGILYHKDPSYYASFKEQGARYTEYVWPRDIDPVHPEQKEELDALAATLEQEEKAKEADAAAKLEKKQQQKQKSSKRKKVSTEDGDDEDASESVSGASDSATASSAAAAAISDTAIATPRKATRADSRRQKGNAQQPSPAGVANLSPAAVSPSASNTPDSTARSKRRRVVLSDSSSAIINAKSVEGAELAAADAVKKVRAKRRIEIQ